MPIAPTYPGVYIDEVASGVRTITGVATAITAFVGRALRGPTNRPIRLQSMADFERKFGELSVQSTMSYAVAQFFLNGGQDAIIVRVAADDAVKATIDAGGLPLEASGEGVWGNALRVRIDHEVAKPEDERTFNLSVQDSKSKLTESFRNLSVDRESPRYVKTVLEQDSALLQAGPGPVPESRPGANAKPERSGVDLFGDDHSEFYYATNNDGQDGGNITSADVEGKELDKTGFYALEKADLFNILCLPPLTRQNDVDLETFKRAHQYCQYRRAFLLIDAPGDTNGIDGAEKLIDDIGLGDQGKNGAVFFPRLKLPDPLKENRLQEFAPCGAIAGVMARTDVQRGVWKAPAGIEATLIGVSDLTLVMTDKENGRLNPLGVNCLRKFPVYGHVVWGSRTLAGSDRLASDWKYLPVRRFTLFLEESLYRGTQWVVFEPNDEPLWSEIRLNVGTFLHSLFRQGAFQGRTPQDAYFVKCDKHTTTQDDINRGIVNIHVGFAPLKPAEFVIIRIQQIAQNTES